LNRLKLFFNELIYSSGFYGTTRKIFSKNGKYILMFHGVSYNRHKGINKEDQPHIVLEEFELILNWLMKRFDFLSLEDAFNNNKSGVLLTFDDGFNNNYSNVYPLLKKYKVPGLFFISTQHVKDPNNWLRFINNNNKGKNFTKNISDEYKSDFFDGISEKNLKKMASDSLITIGSHTVTHPVLTKCSDKELYIELKKSKSYLEKIINKKIDAFAYPFGIYDERVLSHVKKAGYKIAFGTDVINKIGSHLFEIPRIGIYSNKKSYLSAKLSGLYLKPVKIIFPTID
tara:strand:+ start:432 stop:1286 length:855 start_codon:yes stop_codon:yes gene_type:complete